MSATKAAFEAMSIEGKRARVHDAQTVIKHPRAIKDLVSEIAEGRKVSDATVWREAMGEYLTKRGYNQ